MRIAFKPIYPTNIDNLEPTLKDFDLIDQLDPIIEKHYNFYNIFDVQTYSDDSRYLLNLYKINYSRKNFSNVNICTNKLIQVIELNMNFDFDFYFELFSNRYADIWQNNIDLDYIKPYCYASNSRNNIGYYVFRSVATGLFRKMQQLINSNHILCFKYNNRIILAYPISNQETLNALDDILDYFLSAIYEIVRIAEFKLDFIIPEEKGLVKVDMEQWYANHKHKRKK